MQLFMLEVVRLARAMDAASRTSGLSFLVILIRGSRPSAAIGTKFRSLILLEG